MGSIGSMAATHIIITYLRPMRMKTYCKQRILLAEKTMLFLCNLHKSLGKLEFCTI